MKKPQPYHALQRFLRSENLEPRFFWGLRLALAATLPMVWGALTHHIVEAEWISLAAECLCWIELKGSLGQRLRLLVAGIGVLVVAALIGGMAGLYPWVSVGVMLVVGFASGLFKNLGDRGSGLAFVLNVFFILNLAHPFISQEHLLERVGLTLVGGALALAISFAATLMHPTHQPYRRMIAAIWQKVHQLANAVNQGWDGQSARLGLRKLYEQEVSLRHLINTSLHFYTTTGDEVGRAETPSYALAQIRKSAALVATHLMAVCDELQHVQIKEVSPDLRSHIHGLLRAIGDAANRMKELMLEVRDEEHLILETRIERMGRLLEAMEEIKNLARDPAAYERVLQLGKRTHRLLLRSATWLSTLRQDVPTYRSYSLVKTMHILHPKYLWQNLKLLLNFNTFTTRYALRIAMASAMGVWVWKAYDIPYGYWMPFTVAVVVQPYFGATFKKAIDRILGTLLGAVAGGLFLQLPDNDWLEIVVLFICSVLMVYYVRTRYSWAAFFITVGLIVLFEVNEGANPILIIDRATITAAGSILAIIAGYALLPTWDKTYLPRFLALAIAETYRYFLHTYFGFKKEVPWVRFKQTAESANSNAFDSFHRYMEEPVWGKKKYKLFYQLIIQNIRITHELNNHHLQHEGTATQIEGLSGARLAKALTLYRDVLAQMSHIEPRSMERTLQSILVQEDDWLSTYHPHYLEKILFELQSMKRDLAQWQQESASS